MIFFRFSKKNGVWGILGPPSYGIGATIRIGREMLCLPYAVFFVYYQLIYPFEEKNIILKKKYYPEEKILSGFCPF